MSVLNPENFDYNDMMSSTVDAAHEIQFPPSWDREFVAPDQSLGEPIDSLDKLNLPNVSDYDKYRILADAQFADAALKKQDNELIAALDSPNPESRFLANQVKQGHIDLLRKILLKTVEAKKWIGSNVEILNAIGQKYLRADQNPSSNMDERVTNRLAQFEGRVQIATDVDKTLTTHADYLIGIPGSARAEDYMAVEKHGRETFPLVFIKYWREAMHVLEKNFFFIGEKVPFRPGVEEFFQETEIADIPIAVTSANFRPFVNGVISRILTKNIRNIFAVEKNDISATDKGIVLQKLVIADPKRALIYCGDGESDLPALEPAAAKVIAFYFALKGGVFAQELARRGLPFYEYESFEDIVDTLARLGLLETQQSNA